MGCLKLYQEREGLENCSVFFGKTLEKKGGQQIFCIVYSPFGLTFNSWSGDADPKQNYKFQEQERQEETGWDSFKWRNSMPEIGRFLTIDPMAEAFPYNSTYAFSENKVTTHVELEGLEAYFIHGSAQGSNIWTDDLANFIKRTVTSNTTMDVDFKWNYDVVGGRKRNWILNDKSDRTIAARHLVHHIEKTRNPNENITLIGHSHGGNVAIQAAKLLWDKYQIQVEIVNHNTPAFTKQRDIENPNGNWGIYSLDHYYTKQDGVAGGLSGADKYTDLSSNIRNIELKKPLETGWISSHMIWNLNRTEFKSKASENGKKKRKRKKKKTNWPQDR